MVSLKQLRYFDAVAKAGHFGKAAERCSVTQPALSMQIQELEKSLGIRAIPLTPQIAGQLGLEQTTKGLVVTDVDPNSDAGQKGMDRGTVILSANGQPVTTAAQLEAAVKAAQAAGRTAILLRAQARGAPAVSVPIRLR